MMKKFNIIHLAELRSGGWVTDTAHLARSLRICGVDARIYRIRNATTAPRPYGYGIEYYPVTASDILKLPRQAPTLVNVAAAEYHAVTLELLARGALITIHDPTELRVKSYHQRIAQGPVVVHRQGVMQYFPESYYLPHSYVRSCPEAFPPPPWIRRQRLAVCLSRMDFDKNIDWIMDANLKVPPAARVELFGDEHRPYTRFLMEKYSGWKQKDGIKYSRQDPTTAVRQASQYQYMVDMSAIKGDGGGTQYTFLEGMDAGCVCVLNREWTNAGVATKTSLLDTVKSAPAAEMVPNHNCLTVGSAAELAEFLRRAWCGRRSLSNTIQRIQVHAEELLEAHSPKRVVPMLEQILRKTGLL